MAAVHPVPAATAVVALATGTLTLTVERSDWPLDRLCGFGTRRNPRRGFLIVSKVLGRHIPARPAEIRASMRDLAGKVPADLPEPFLAVGLAETAVALGHGVFAALRGQGRDGAFLHSTRQRVDHPLLCRFDEPHSHAPDQLLYRPRDVDLGAVRSLLLVDDEVSTGTTLANLAQALLAALPRCERIVAVTLTDWSGGRDWLDSLGRPAECVSLLRGTLRWESGPQAPADDGEEAGGALGRLPDGGRFGRVGTAEAGTSLPAAIAALQPPPHARLRVVGTGEFTYPPLLLAERLEQDGHDVVVQATTRSPVRVDGAIRHKLAFRDNYGSGIANYLYNADPADDRLSLICHESPPGSVDPRLVAMLGGRTLYFGGS